MWTLRWNCIWISFLFCLFTNSAAFSYASIEQVILHIALRRKCVVKDGFCWHPFEGKFLVSFAVVNFLFIHVATQSKVWHFCNFLFSNKYISSRQIAMNISVSCQVFLIQGKKNSVKNLKRPVKSNYVERPLERTLSLSLYCRISPKTTKRFQAFEDAREKICSFSSVIYRPWVLIGRESHLSLELHNAEPKSLKLPRRRSMAVFLQWSTIFSGK